MASRTMMTQRKPPTGSHLKRGNQQSDKCEAFCVTLANKIDALEQAVHPKWMTLEWVAVAVEFMRTTYSDMVTLFEDLRALSQDVRGSEDFWVEEYMVESMKLLDVCNVIKPAMSRFEHLMMCVQLVVQASQRFKINTSRTLPTSTKLLTIVWVSEQCPGRFWATSLKFQMFPSPIGHMLTSFGCPFIQSTFIL
jgi:hypothetical protein